MRYRIKKAKTGFVVTVEDDEGKVVEKHDAKTMDAAVKARDAAFAKHR